MAITINGSGTITGISQGGLNDNIITQSELANTGVAGNGPAFSAYKTGQQTGISYGVWTKVQFPTEDFDTASCYDNVTNYRFTPNVAGYYQVNAVIYANNVGGSSTGGYQCAIYKTGSSWCYGSASTSASTDYSSNVSTLVYCNGLTDYIEVYVIGTGSGGSFQINGGGGGGLVKFSASMTRAA